MSPVVAELIFTATPKFLEYPSFSISGPRILPIADADAIADPDIEPISIAEIIFIKAKPPGKKPTIVLAKEINLVAMPPEFIIWPERINRGTAKSAKLSSPVAILCETVVNADTIGTLTKIVNKEEIEIDHATGAEIDNNIMNEKTRTIIGINSITYYNW